ncbi:MAG: hypothetical protein QM638_13500 [Nocardioides sp.]|uniref:hypothetical protein n=1 Tax=Nocardioides sp. TaxID=35761 RepID=UPI0039E66B59
MAITMSVERRAVCGCGRDIDTIVRLSTARRPVRRATFCHSVHDGSSGVTDDGATDDMDNNKRIRVRLRAVLNRRALVMPTISRSMRHPALMAAVLAVAVVGVIVAINLDGTRNPRVVVVEASEMTSSTTIADWARVADYVVVGKVTAEERVEPGDSETADAGDDLVGRNITVAVDTVVWKAAGVTREQPSTFTMAAYGWQHSSSGEVELAPEAGARLEVGHQYVLALAWMAAHCSTDGESTPAQWTTIGSGGALPADDGFVGDGEFEGTVTDAASTSETDSVLDRYRGDRPARVGEGVGAVEPARSDIFSAADPDCAA